VTAPVATLDTRTAPPARSGRRRPRLTFLGVVPFFLFAFMFLGLPTLYLVVGSFQTKAPDGSTSFTVQNYVNLARPFTANSYEASLEISFVTALSAGIFGFILAYAVISGGLPGRVRTFITTFSGVASNFAGIPLALAFIFTIGRTGFLTVLLKDVGLNLYDAGFSIYTKIGLEIVYFYFQLPLMILIIAPAIDGLKQEWREASENAGASTIQFWRYVALPVLMPSLLGSMILLFGNAFGAQATAYALTGGFIPLVTIVISGQLSGDVLGDQNLGYALAMGMVVIMAVTLIAYTFLTRRAERWQR
jgi:putative spermidine/putrescine transport system permease protein